MVVRVRRQVAVGQVNAPTIEKFATGRHSHQHR